MYHGTSSFISSIVLSIRETPSIVPLLIGIFFPVEKLFTHVLIIYKHLLYNTVSILDSSDPEFATVNDFVRVPAGEGDNIPATMTEPHWVLLRKGG